MPGESAELGSKSEGPAPIMAVDQIIGRFGGISKLAAALGHRHPTRVQSWRDSGSIPAKHHLDILNAAVATGVKLRREWFAAFPLNHAAFEDTDVAENSSPEKAA